MNNNNYMTYIIYGNIGSGKTTSLNKLINKELEKQHYICTVNKYNYNEIYLNTISDEHLIVFSIEEMLELQNNDKTPLEVAQYIYSYCLSRTGKDRFNILAIDGLKQFNFSEKYPIEEYFKELSSFCKNNNTYFICTVDSEINSNEITVDNISDVYKNYSNIIQIIK